MERSGRLRRGYIGINIVRINIVGLNVIGFAIIRFNIIRGRLRRYVPWRFDVIGRGTNKLRIRDFRVIGFGNYDLDVALIRLYRSTASNTSNSTTRVTETKDMNPSLVRCGSSDWRVLGTLFLASFCT